VAKQAARYVDAIHLTVVAAYSGYTATTDVLGLADMLDDPNLDASLYVAGMFALATESEVKATKALNSLREIRRELMKVSPEKFDPGTLLIRE